MLKKGLNPKFLPKIEKKRSIWKKRIKNIDLAFEANSSTPAKHTFFNFKTLWNRELYCVKNTYIHSFNSKEILLIFDGIFIKDI